MNDKIEQQPEPVTMPEELKNWKPHCPEMLAPEVYQMQMSAHPQGISILQNSNAIQSIIGYLADLTKKICELEKQLSDHMDLIKDLITVNKAANHLGSILEKDRDDA